MLLQELELLKSMADVQFELQYKRVYMLFE